MTSLLQIKNSLIPYGVDLGKIDAAAASLSELLDEMDNVQVKGRDSIDVFFGCMLALEAIIGGDNG